jgi:hypothetical protein
MVRGNNHKRQEQQVIRLALEVLSGAVDRAGKRKVKAVDVQLALRCLVPHCPENWPLVQFWDSAGQENDIGRSQGVTASYNGICVQLKAAGRYPASR